MRFIRATRNALQRCVASALTLTAFVAIAADADEASAPVARALSVERPARTEPVDFQREILPVLQANCLPCHNKTTTKADLLLETPADMLRGGESGPALVAGKPDESLLFKVSAHVAKPRMPPKDNKANAVNLTPRELGLLSLWIEQGAKDSEKRALEIRWEAPAERIRSVYALGIAADGHVGAAGRGNQLALLDPLDGRHRGWITDGGVSTNPAPVHRDLVNAVAVSLDGAWIASGGYREIKVWHRTNALLGSWEVMPGPATNAFPAEPLRAPSGDRVLRLSTNGVPEIADSKDALLAALHPGPRLPDWDGARRLKLAEAELEACRRRAEAADKELAAQTERERKAAEAMAAARKVGAEKSAAEAQARRKFVLAEGTLALAERRGGSTNDLKKLRDALEEARKPMDAAVGEVGKAQIRIDAAGEELRLAGVVRQRAFTESLVARQAVQGAESVRREAAAAAGRPGWTSVRAAGWSPSGKRVAVLAGDQVHVWSGESGAWVGSVAVEGAAARIGFRDESTLEIGKADDSGRSARWVFEPDYRLVATLGTGGDDSPLPDRVNALAFRPDGLRLASGSGEPTRGGEVRVWDPATGRHLYGLTNLHSDAVLALAWSADGSRLASGGADRFARVIDVSDGHVIANLEGHTGHVLGVSWRADGRVLATGGADGSVKFWTLGSADRAKTVGGFAKEVVALAHIGTGGDVVAVPGETDLVRVTEAGEKPGTLPGAKDFHHAAAVTVDGRWLLAAGQEGVVRVWDVETRKLVREMGR